jgi:hypothetical protein
MANVQLDQNLSIFTDPRRLLFFNETAMRCMISDAALLCDCMIVAQIDVGRRLGQLYKVRFELHNEPSGSGWFLEQVGEASVKLAFNKHFA